VMPNASLSVQTVIIIIILCDLLRCTNEHLNCVLDRSAVCTLNALQPEPAEQLLHGERHTGATLLQKQAGPPADRYAE